MPDNTKKDADHAHEEEADAVATPGVPGSQAEPDNSPTGKRKDTPPHSGEYWDRFNYLKKKETDGTMRAQEQEELLSLRKYFGEVAETDNPGAIEPTPGGTVKKETL